MTKPPLRTRLLETDEFVTVLEIVPSRGLALDPPARRSLDAARALVGDPRVAAVSITDNAGGHAMASPVPIAEELLARGQDVIVHVACRDRSRNALRSLGWELEARGIRNVLAVSGDYPVEGTGGLSRPGLRRRLDWACWPSTATSPTSPGRTARSTRPVSSSGRPSRRSSDSRPR